MSKPFKSFMLASNVAADKTRFPVLASFKFDGIRAGVEELGDWHKYRTVALFSRNGKEIPNLHCQGLFAQVKALGFDGELIFGSPTAKDVFNATQSAVMSADGSPDVKFYVFDLRHKDDWALNTRLTALDRLLTPELKRRGFIMVEQVVIYDQAGLDAYEAKALKLGYEGIMVRDSQGLYKYGRSTVKEGGMLRVKRFEDSEGEIIGYEEQMENTNEQTTDELGRAKRSSHKAGKVGKGVLGSWQLRDVKTGVEFWCGAGISDDDRLKWWKARKKMMGTFMKYKYQAVGVKDKPRIPSIIGPRDKRDM